MTAAVMGGQRIRHDRHKPGYHRNYHRSWWTDCRISSTWAHAKGECSKHGYSAFWGNDYPWSWNWHELGDVSRVCSA